MKIVVYSLMRPTAINIYTCTELKMTYKLIDFRQRWMS